MAHAFLSYSSRDADVADRLVADLRGHGVEVWYDKDLRAGERWEPMLADQLRRADAVIVLITPASLQSNWVEMEWSTALGRSARVVPVLVNGVRPHDLPEPLRELVAVFLDQDYREGVRKLAASIKQLAGSTAPPAAEAVDIDRLVEDAVNRLFKRQERDGSEQRDDKLVFVICSFDPQMEPAVDAIKAAAEAVGLRAERVKDVKGDYRITEKMLAMIRTARFVVADLTQERPNVYFELGYARGIGRDVITVAREDTRIHFDVYDRPYIPYFDSRYLERDLLARFRDELNDDQ